MRDLQNPKLIWLKGWLFLFLGVVSVTTLFLDSPTPHTALLLALAVWSFCRAYYFAFYVIEHYVDSGYRFAGLISFCRYLFRKRG
jgi:hypothetical protein